MSRIAWFCIPAWGHTNPTVEVVRVLTARGHQVRYYTFAPFREKLEAAGAEVRLCDKFMPPPPPDLDRRVGRDFASMVGMLTDTALDMEAPVCQELEAWRPDLLVVDSVCLWGKLFAWKLQLPWVCSTTTFAFNQQTAALMRPGLAETARMALGLGRIRRDMARLRQRGYPAEDLRQLLENRADTDTIVYTSRLFQPMAETFGDRFAFVGPSLPQVPPLKHRGDRPLVYISLGTVMHRRPGFYRACFRALGGRDLDVVLSVGEATDPAALGPAPGNFRVERRVDQLAVLAEADAFLTHCGMNSANEAIFCQVPTIFFPQQGEEAAVADRMESLGLGVRLRRETPAAIRRAVETALGEPRFRENAARVAESFRAAGSAGAAADFLERVLDRKNSGRS